MSDTARSIILRLPEVHSLFTEGCAVLRRPVHWPRHLSCRVPDWSRAWVDKGGTIWGPGPYLKVPNRHHRELHEPDWETENRVFCPWGYPGDRLRARNRSKPPVRLWVEVVSVDVERAAEGWEWVLAVRRVEGERP